MNHYETLSIPRNATQDEIKAAWKKGVVAWHPDKTKHPGAQEKFLAIQEAFRVLSDAKLRGTYDEKLLQECSAEEVLDEYLRNSRSLKADAPPKASVMRFTPEQIHAALVHMYSMKGV